METIVVTRKNQSVLPLCGIYGFDVFPQQPSEYAWTTTVITLKALFVCVWKITHTCLILEYLKPGREHNPNTFDAKHPPTRPYTRLLIGFL